MENKKYVQIIIEYDGFEHHFKNKDRVNEMNYEHYYKDDDIYREKVLEGYGYTFEINRFNLGTNPVETLDARFNKIIEKKSSHKINEYYKHLKDELISNKVDEEEESNPQ